MSCCMARMARVVVPEIPYHIVQRGNRRQRVFFEDGDHHFYLNLLVDNARHNDVSIWAYCLNEHCFMSLDGMSPKRLAEHWERELTA